MTVIIPVYKDAEGLKDTLDSLKKQSLPQGTFEVIVGNDGHDRYISELCKSYKIHEVFTEKNLGSYTIRDLAIASASGEFLSFTDADIMVSSSWLENCKKLFSEGYDYIGGPVTIDKKKIKTLTNQFVSFYEFDNETLFNTTHFTATANVHVRRKVIEKIGGFDRRLVSAGDLEFGDRVYRSGIFKQIFSNTIPVTHPPRNYAAFMKKLKRISGGERDLAQYYPGRFNRFHKSIYAELRTALYFPQLPATLPMERRVIFTLLGIWFQLYRAVNNIKNR